MSTGRPEIVCLSCCRNSVGDNETLSRYQIGFPAKVNLMRRLLELPVTRGETPEVANQPLNQTK